MSTMILVQGPHVKETAVVITVRSTLPWEQVEGKGTAREWDVTMPSDVRPFWKDFLGLSADQVSQLQDEARALRGNVS